MALVRAAHPFYGDIENLHQPFDIKPQWGIIKYERTKFTNRCRNA
jgi:hypothetical protein